MRLIPFLIGCLLLVPQTLGAPSEPTVDDLLAKLNNPDPQVRDEIVKQIEAMGESARPALIKASQSHNSRTSGRAAELLMKLPFFREDDSAIVRTILADYHKKSADERKAVLFGDLARQPDAGSVMLRIFQEDPDEQVAWGISDCYAGQPDEFWKPLLSADLSNARPAVLEAAARGILFEDRPKAIAYLTRALAAEEKYPAAPIEHARQMYQLVSADAQVNGRLTEALMWQRKLAALPVPASPTATDEEISLDPSPLHSLLGFYAGVGPVDGFGEDLETYRDEIIEPENLFGLSQVFDFPGFSAFANALQHTAIACLESDVHERNRVGQLLYQRQWIRPMHIVLEGVVQQFAAMGNGPRDMTEEWYARRTLYRLAREIGDDAAAIRHTEAEIKLYEQNGIGQAVTMLNARVEGHRMHLAREKKDKAQMAKSAAFLASLGELESVDADIGIDWINGLSELGQTDQAKKVFASFFTEHMKMVANSADSAASLNNIAWLCAGVGMKTDYALDAARRAIRAEPANYGYIDTAAEAYFRVGQIDRAIELETFALALRPGDQFLLKQRAKFEAARK